MCANKFRLVCCEPHDAPKRVRDCVSPTELAFDGALRVKGPKCVVVEKDRAAGEKEENVRVSGEAYRNVPRGIAASIVDVVGGVERLEEWLYLGRKDGIGTVVRYSGMLGFSIGCSTTASFSLSLRAGVCCLVATALLLPLRCHGAFNTFAIAGHNSLVAEAICGRPTGA